MIDRIQILAFTVFSFLTINFAQAQFIKLADTPAPKYITNQFGPFGQQNKTYDVPEKAIIVAPNGKATSSGKTVNKPTTLENAIKIAQTDDVIVLRGGIYRTGNLEFSKAITIQPYLNETPIIKGSKVAKNWERTGELWKTNWTTLFKKRNRSKNKPENACFWNGDRVFYNGDMLTPTNELKDLSDGQFYVDYSNKEIYIANNPKGNLLEITAFYRGFKRLHDKTSDPKGPTIQGLTIMHYPTSAIVVSGNDIYDIIKPGQMPDAPIGTKILNNKILFCADKGLYIISPKSHIAYNQISMHNHLGMMIRQAHESIIEHNIVSGTNMFDLDRFPAGINVFNQSSKTIARHNYFYNNASNALWYDVGHHDCVTVKNYFKDNRHCLKVEISHKTYFIGNVVDNSVLWLTNSSNNQVYYNTFLNTYVHVERNNRGSKSKFNSTFNHALAGPGVWNYNGHEIINNVFAGDAPFYIRHKDMNEFDKTYGIQTIANNVFKKSDKSFASSSYLAKNIGSITPGDEVIYGSYEDYQKVFPDILDSNYITNLNDSQLFNDVEAGNYELNEIHQFSPYHKIPKVILKHLELSPKNKLPGAFYSK